MEAIIIDHNLPSNGQLMSHSNERISLCFLLKFGHDSLWVLIA